MNEGSGARYDAVLREAAHRLAEALAPYRVMTRERLAEFSGASSWNTVGFDVALRWAVDREFLRRLDDYLYEIVTAANRDEGRRAVVKGGG